MQPNTVREHQIHIWNDNIADLHMLAINFTGQEWPYIEIVCLRMSNLKDYLKTLVSCKSKDVCFTLP